MNRKDLAQMCAIAATELENYVLAETNMVMTLKAFDHADKLLEYCLARDFPAPEVLYRKNCEFQGLRPQADWPVVAFTVFRVVAQALAPMIEETPAEPAAPPQPAGTGFRRTMGKQSRPGDRSMLAHDAALVERAKKAEEDKAAATLEAAENAPDSEDQRRRGPPMPPPARQKPARKPKK